MATAMCMDVDPELYNVDWTDCPLDILLCVFDYLDLGDLGVCMFLNGSWRSAVSYYFKIKNKWKKFLTAANISGSRLKLENNEPNNADFEQMFYNYITWHSAKIAKFEFVHQQKIDKIKSIKIYKEYLIVVTADRVEYYYAKTLAKRGTVTVPTDTDYYKIKDYHENDHMYIAVTEGDDHFNLEGYEKRSLRHGFDLRLIDKRKIFEVDEVRSYKFIGNDCYVLDGYSTLLSYDRRGDYYFKARFYSTMWVKALTKIDRFGDELYMLRCDGSVYYADRRKRSFQTLSPVLKEDITNLHRFPFLRIKDPDIDVKEYTWFVQLHEEAKITERRTPYYPPYSSVRLKPWRPGAHRFKVRDTDVAILVHVLRKHTCVFELDDILFFGYPNGTVEITTQFLLKENTCLRMLSIKKIRKNISDPRVIAIEVYEDKDIQYLIIATRTDIIQLRLNTILNMNQKCRFEVFEEIYDNVSPLYTQISSQSY